MSHEDLTTTVEFRQISRFPGYRFGSDGSVWSCRKRRPTDILLDRWTIIKQYTTVKGYKTIKLHNRIGGVSDGKVHRLILEAFVGPCPPGQECRHLNGDGSDNRWPENLAWGSRAENESDRVRHGTHPIGSKNPMSKLTEDDIREIRIRLAKKEQGTSIAESFGVTKQEIYQIKHGKIWSHLK